MVQDAWLRLRAHRRRRDPRPAGLADDDRVAAGAGRAALGAGAPRGVRRAVAARADRGASPARRSAPRRPRTSSLALLVVLESLSATERIAFVLHDIFGYAFDEVATALQTDAGGRAAARVAGAQGGRGAAAALPGDARAAARRGAGVRPRRARGRHAGARGLLHPDVVFTSDGGGVVTAARKPIVGADRVARVAKTLGRKGIEAGGTLELVDINGMPGWLAHRRRRRRDGHELHDRRRQDRRDRRPAQPGEAAEAAVKGLPRVTHEMPARAAQAARARGLQGTETTTPLLLRPAADSGRGRGRG